MKVDTDLHISFKPPFFMTKVAEFGTSFSYKSYRTSLCYFTTCIQSRQFQSYISHFGFISTPKVNNYKDKEVIIIVILTNSVDIVHRLFTQISNKLLLSALDKHFYNAKILLSLFM